MEVTIVADGAAAREVHLGYDRGAQGQPTGNTKSTPKRAPSAATVRKEEAPTEKAPRRIPREAANAKAATAATKAGAQEGADDEDDEVPGTIKSYDATRRILVVSLLNGTSRSFLLSREVKVLVRGTPSRQGLSDPALSAGTRVTILVEAGGRRVRELHVDPRPVAKGKRAAS